MILLADGGSSKVDWRLIDKGDEILQIKTNGANPFIRDTKDISDELGEKLIPKIKDYTISAVHFFGAGCAFPEKNEIIRQAIATHLPDISIEVGSDLIAAAKGLCGKDKGIVCIIGTGSNSCYYDGERVVENVPSLGYILGDEGSGAVIGRLFLNACLKNQLTKGIKEKFFEETGLDIATILNKVYKEPLPNKFLASFAPFILKNIADGSIYNLVYNSFKSFFVRNIMQYDYQHNTANFTGSVAFHFQDILKNVAKDLNIKIGQITQSPMGGLIKYYTEK